jgi:hypothetical protein
MEPMKNITTCINLQNLSKVDKIQKEQKFTTREDSQAKS